MLRRLIQGGIAVTWIAVMAMGAVVAARFWSWDTRVSFVALNAVLPIVLLPAWAALLVAALTRRKALALASAVVVAAHVLVVAPELTARSPVPAWAHGAPTVRMMTANVLVGSGDATSIAAEVRRHEPDVVVLLESPVDLAAAVLAGDLGPRYPFRFQVDRHDPFALTILSTRPLEVPEVVANSGRPVAVVTGVVVGGARVRIIAVHAIAPAGWGRPVWIRDVELIRRAAQGSGPTVVLGDFNATWNHRAFRELLADGFEDAAAARGRPFDMTWPRSGLPAPPVMRLDHILTGKGAVATWVRAGDIAGSDHRYVVGDVAVRR